MIKSMTGYGKAEAQLDNGKLTVEIRSLNGKSAEIGIKTSLLPRGKELEVRSRLSSRLNRGNIDLFVNWVPNAAEDAKQINTDLALDYYRQIMELKKLINYTCPGTLSSGKDEAADMISTVLRMPDVLDSKKQDVISDENWPIVSDAIDMAVASLIEFRSREGEALYKDVTSKVSSILSHVDEVEGFEKERIDMVRERILSRFNDLKLDVESSRLESEMIFYIEKLDINEEKVRLRQHCRYFLDTLENDPQPGKKLGFVAQEMGREINTMGSKANHAEIQKIVVMMKDELEKIKEQSMNIL